MLRKSNVLHIEAAGWAEYFKKLLAFSQDVAEVY